MVYTHSLRSCEKVPTLARPTILPKPDPRAVADGRKQEGFILLPGKLPH